MPNFKMTRILTTILLLTFGLTSFGQKISVDTLFIPKTEKITHFQNDKLKFPIFKTGDLNVDNIINKDLKDRFTNNEYTDLPTDSTIIKWADEQVIYLDFEVTYIKNGLISLNISAEGCGAHCTAWTDYFTYNYMTGQYLTIDQIIDTTGNFKTRVVADKNKQYKQQSSELRERLTDKETGFDKETFDIVIEYYLECSKSFHYKSFALHKDYLEIIENCYLPNVIKSMKPVIELKYKYADIKKDLRIKN